MFVLQNTRVPTLSLRDAGVEPLAAEIGSAKFDLTAAVSESDTGLRVAVEYRSDLFDASTIERLLSHFDTLLEAGMREPHTEVDALPLLPTRERAQLLEEWAGPRGRDSGGGTLGVMPEVQR